ncbi:MAG: glutathione S-transferase family protein [Myxococcales bacterium]|nr:MAG: glutathione S-transferase family protein [Myxococcales bacterium]
MKLFGHPGSTCTRKVLCTMNELGVSHEFELVDLAKGEHKLEANLKRQPFGKIPSFEDGDVRLFESRTICRYLSDAHGQGKLTPADAAGRARMNLAIDIEASYFTPHAMTFIYEHVFKRPQGDEKLASAQQSLDHTLDVLDGILARTPYLAGADFTLGDIVYLPYLEYLALTPVFASVKARPNVSAWWTRCSERPGWQKAAGR